MDIKKSIQELEKLGADLYGKDFLLTWEKSDAEIHAVLKIAEILKEMHAQNIPAAMFKTGLAVSNFRDNSTRTRFSFSSACNLLGLAVQDFDEGSSQVAHGETVRETATMISFMADVIGIRDDIVDPFVNPAKGARLTRAHIFAAPTVYSVSDDLGAGATLERQQARPRPR